MENHRLINDYEARLENRSAHNKSKKIKINALASMTQQIVSIMCGFILPKLILQNFGSSYNGLTSSITQFISCITLLSAGIGGVTRAALYKPLSENNTAEISCIVATTHAFMRKVSIVFASLLVLFAAIYPILINKEFDWFFSFSLILIISTSTFVSNFFGVTYQLLLRADQRNYVVLFVQTVTTIIHTIIASVLLIQDCNLHLVKIGSTSVYIIQPIIIMMYCKKYYHINVKAPKNNKYISQRWDAFAQRVALFIHSNTDVIILSAYMTLADVSVYSVYSYVIFGIEQLIKSLCVGVDAAFGNLLITKNTKYLNEKFNQVEYVVSSATLVLFTSTAILIIPFIQLYTEGVDDVNYRQPLFAALFILSESIFCIRTPYQDLIEAKGVFKELRNGAVIEMAINIVLSIILVRKVGLIGVSIGTLVAMIFRTVQYVYYLRKNIIYRPITLFLKRLVMLLISVILSVLGVWAVIDYQCDTYFDWIIAGGKTVVITGIVWFCMSLIFDWKNLIGLLAFMGIDLKKKKRGIV